MSRETIAWLLIGLMVVARAAAIAWRVYYARDRVIDRQRGRERASRERRAPEQTDD